ncbi:MAG: hypothetical protein ACRDN6_10790 [Gaiellaceae bacterium]
MRELLSSPRQRRRLAWTIGLGGFLVGAVVFGIAIPNTGESLDTPVGQEAAPVATTDVPQLAVTPAVRRQVGETVQRFVRTAVVRKDLPSAWPLASPIMREGVTRSEWDRGDIPVQPFPARALAGADWLLRYVSDRTLGIDVMVQPKPRSGAPVMVYSAELTAAGSGARRRFLVDYWIPQATLGVAAAPEKKPPGREEPDVAAQLSYDKGKLGPEWFLVPASIAVLLLLTLAGFGVRGVLQRRRAERHYREQFHR